MSSKADSMSSKVNVQLVEKNCWEEGTYIFRPGQMLCTAIISTMKWAAGSIDWTLLPNDSFSQPARERCRNGLRLSKRPTTARLSAKAAWIYSQVLRRLVCIDFDLYCSHIIQASVKLSRQQQQIDCFKVAICCLYSVNQCWSSLYPLHQLWVAPWLPVSSIHTSLDFLSVFW